jgi:hypothetical protein
MIIFNGMEAFSPKSWMPYFPEGGRFSSREMNAFIFLLTGALSPWRYVELFSLKMEVFSPRDGCLFFRKWRHFPPEDGAGFPWRKRLFTAKDGCLFSRIRRPFPPRARRLYFPEYGGHLFP